ncbi:amino acid permease [Pseudaeromonas sp. ZJS20]|uniref:amino acid permease n=1 Tax=Pseudaeromonas aegiceratis TaxID=3153928 RepID=UPI00390C4545
MDAQHQTDELHRGLSNRHVQLIALGGAIGTGLFYAIGSTIAMAGPAVLLGYAVAGFIAFLIMRQLGEMVAEEPVSGSFSHFAYRYWNGFAGFLSGWNYWVLYVLVSMAELTVVGKYVQFWFPDIPTWVSAAVFFVVINGINLANVKLFGEMEFWFSIIKVVAILGMIGFGCWLLVTGKGGEQAMVSNLWNNGGFMPNGWHGLIMSLAIIMFSFGGLELVGITAAETSDPKRTIPKAVNQVIYRILIFYVGALAVLLSLYPWQQITADSSPFVMIFNSIGAVPVANVLNVVVLTAALSVYNSCVYCNSRMLHGLAQQGNAPKVLAKTDKRGVPVVAIGLSALTTLICVVINYVIPGEAFKLLMSLVVSALVINWAMISMTHIKFRRAKQTEGVEPGFKAFWFPFANYLCLAFLAGMLVILYLLGETISVYLMPCWLLIIWVGYQAKRRADAKALPLTQASDAA